MQQNEKNFVDRLAIRDQANGTILKSLWFVMIGEFSIGHLRGQHQLTRRFRLLN